MCRGVKFDMVSRDGVLKRLPYAYLMVTLCVPSYAYLLIAALCLPYDYPDLLMPTLWLPYAYDLMATLRLLPYGCLLMSTLWLPYCYLMLTILCLPYGHLMANLCLPYGYLPCMPSAYLMVIFRACLIPTLW